MLKFNFNKNLLHIAIENRNLEIFQLLLSDQRIDVNYIQISNQIH